MMHLCAQMGSLEQATERSGLSQRLELPQVDLPPEESLNLTQLVPELDLLGDKEKKDDSDEEEVRKSRRMASPTTVLFLSLC